MKILNNNIAVIEGDNCISKWVEETGRLDHDQNALPYILPHINEGNTVLDIGAYIGDHTIAYSNKVGETGEVMAFEPSINAYRCLKHNMLGIKNVFCQQVAVGLKNGRTDIQEVEGNDGMNYILEGGTVEMIKIDFLKLKKCDFIKIDVEGYELDVLKGAKNTIKKFKPKLLIEINNETLTRVGVDRKQIFEWLNDMGYEYENIYEPFGQGLYEPQMDIICKVK
jgi:FkbM family methyltransferase